jgi:hypothetical protein
MLIRGPEREPVSRYYRAGIPLVASFFGLLRMRGWFG